MNYTLGQKLWFDPTHYNRHNGGFEITISKVGRKWAEYKVHGVTYRVEIGTTKVDGGKYISPGTLWESQAAWEEHKALVDAWNDFARRVSVGSAPSGLTMKELKAAKKLLGFSCSRELR